MCNETEERLDTKVVEVLRSIFSSKGDDYSHIKFIECDTESNDFAKVGNKSLYYDSTTNGVEIYNINVCDVLCDSAFVIDFRCVSGDWSDFNGCIYALKERADDSKVPFEVVDTACQVVADLSRCKVHLDRGKEDDITYIPDSQENVVAKYKEHDL